MWLCGRAVTQERGWGEETGREWIGERDWKGSDETGETEPLPRGTGERGGLGWRTRRTREPGEPENQGVRPEIAEYTVNINTVYSVYMYCHFVYCCIYIQYIQYIQYIPGVRNVCIYSI